MDGDECTVLGYSSGAWLALALAGYLERKGRTLAGVVLLDPSSSGVDMPALLDRAVRGPHPVPDAHLTAMVHCVRILNGLRASTPTPLRAPILVVRPEARIREVTPSIDEDLRTWFRSVTVARVPGTHFSILDANAQDTARAMDLWTTSEESLVPGASRDVRETRN
jgi:thioesterase domain-containing protein